VFRLSTFEPDDGAFPGSYKVTVRPATAADPDLAITIREEAMAARLARKPRRRRSDTFPARYSQPSQTVLVKNVPAKGEVVFELQSK
jgi:hypothetical protein